MRVCYCVLWMPTIIHKEFDGFIKEKSEIFEISDELSTNVLNENGDNRIFAKVKLQDGANIAIELYKDKRGKQILDNSLLLKNEGKSHNGLFKYKIELPDDGHFLIWEEGDEKPVFPCDIYHVIKEFYHIHEHHKADDGDSMLNPYISFANVNLNDDNNAALAHYMEQYETKFRNGHLYLQHIYNRLINRPVWSNLHMFFSANSNHHSFYRIASRLKGDKTYYNSLYFSCYNTDIKVKEIKDKNSVNKEKYRKAFNVENIIRSIFNMEERVNNRFALSTFRTSFWIAIAAVLISIYTYFLSQNSSVSTNIHTEQLLEKKHMELQNEIDGVSSQIKELEHTTNIRLDSIYHSIKEKSKKENRHTASPAKTDNKK